MQPRNKSGRNFRGHFDFDAFLSAVDAERMARDMSWRQVAQATGISPSSLTRMAQGKRLDVDGLVAMASWAGLSLEQYYKTEKSEPAVPAAVTRAAALLRADPNLSKDDAAHLESLLRASYEHLRRKSERR